MSGIKARAEILFFTDSFDKPQVMLTGRWSAREINKVGALLYKAYRLHLRAIQRGEKSLKENLDLETTFDLTSVEEIEESEDAEKEEVSDGRER